MKRRILSLRFSLRALLIVISLACVWLAWEANVVQERKRLRTEAEHLGACVFFSANDMTIASITLRFGESPPQISFTRRLLGDQAIETIRYNPGATGFTTQKLSALKWVFSEAYFVNAETPLSPDL